MFTGKSKITKVFSVFVASLFVLSGVPASANASENAAVDGSLVYPAAVYADPVNSKEPIKNVTDGEWLTRYKIVGAAQSSIWVDMGSNQPVTGLEVIVAWGKISDIQVYASDAIDDSKIGSAIASLQHASASKVGINKYEGCTKVSMNGYYFNFSEVHASRYYKIAVTTTADELIGELQFYNFADNLLKDAEMTATNQNPSYPITNVVDGNPLVRYSHGSGNGATIEAELIEEKTFDTFELYDYAERIKEYKLYKGNKNAETQKVIYAEMPFLTQTITPSTLASDRVRLVSKMEQAVAMQYIKIELTCSTTPSVWEMGLYQSVPESEAKLSATGNLAIEKDGVKVPVNGVTAGDMYAQLDIAGAESGEKTYVMAAYRDSELIGTAVQTSNTAKVEIGPLHLDSADGVSVRLFYLASFQTLQPLTVTTDVSENLAKGSNVTLEGDFNGTTYEYLPEDNLTDGDPNSYWASKAKTGSIILDLLCYISRMTRRRGINVTMVPVKEFVLRKANGENFPSQRSMRGILKFR